MGLRVSRERFLTRSSPWEPLLEGATVGRPGSTAEPVAGKEEAGETDGGVHRGHHRGSRARECRAWVIIHRSRGGVHLSRYTTAQGQRTSQLWTFPNLYELLLFAGREGFAEVDPEAEDWLPVFPAS